MDDKQNKKTKISEIHYKDSCFLIKSFLDDNQKNKILNFIEEDQKNELFLLNDNLINTERTGWEYHKRLEFRDYYDIILKELYECMIVYSLRIGCGDTRDRTLFAENKVKFSLFMLNTWFAR